MFNITERPTATGTLLVDTQQNLPHQETAVQIEYNSIRGHIVSEIREEIESVIAQKLKPLLENSESLIKSVKEAYAHQLKVLKEELNCKNKIMNTLTKIIENFGNDKCDTQPVPLTNFGKAKPIINQKNNSKVTIINSKISSKELGENSKEIVALTQSELLTSLRS